MQGKSRVQAEIATLGQEGRDIIDVVATSLHNIAPNVILAKREVSLCVLIVYVFRVMKDAV